MLQPRVGMIPRKRGSILSGARGRKSARRSAGGPIATGSAVKAAAFSKGALNSHRPRTGMA